MNYFWMILGWYMLIGVGWFAVAKWIEPKIMEEMYGKTPINKNIVDVIAMLGCSILWLPMLFIVIPEMIKERRKK